MRRFLYFFVALSASLFSIGVSAQGIGRDILKRWDNNGQTLRGDFVQIGNHKTGSATLKISGHSSCLRVKWAGLYWASTGSLTREGDDSTYTATFKLPNGQSVPLRADERMTTVFGGHEFLWNSFKDVTSILQGLGTSFNNGDYQVTYSTGSWGIWNLVVVYEDVNASTSKRIYVYDGCLLNFYNYNGVQHKTIPITGFQTPPAPAAIKARIGVCTGAGNINSYDILEINGHKQGQGSYPNAYEDFMDASISFNHSEAAMPRNPVLGRGQGFADLDVFDIPNPNNTVIKNGDTSLEIHFAAEDAYITYTVPFSIDAIAPHIETHKEVLGLENAQWKDFTGKTTVFGDALKYRLKFRNIGNDNVRDAILEDLLPKGVTYDNFEALPTGVTFISATPNYNNTGRTLVKFNVDPSLLQHSSTAPFSAPITINVKVQPDCANLIDFCSNEFKNQAEMVYHAVLDNKEYRTGSFANVGGACDQNSESATTFFVKDETCQAQDLPYCGNMTLKGGAGFAAWKWTKEGQAGVLSTSQDLPISSPGVYWVERTPPPGGNRCSNQLRIKYNVQTRTGENLHPMRNEYYVTERKTCNNTGMEYLGVAVCNTMVPMAINNASLTDGQVTWYRYKTQRAVDDCPPAVNNTGIESDGAWELVHTGKNFNMTPELVKYANGTEFAVRLGFPQCPLTYHFRAYKGEITYNVAAENIICGTGNIKVTGIPTGTFQYKLQGPASSNYTDLPTGQTSINIPVTQPGLYKVYLRPKVTQFQENVCEYIKEVTVAEVTDANAFTLTQVEEVKCVSSSPNTGKMRVVVNADVTLPVKVEVKKGTSLIHTYTVTNTTQLNSDNIPATKAVLQALVAGNDYSVILTPTYKAGCAVTQNNFEITKIPELKINNGAAKTIACGLEKELTITVQGGKLNSVNGRYHFTVDGFRNTDISEVFENKGGTPEVHTYTLKIKDPWSGPGSKVYRVKVYDENNCMASRDITYLYQEKPTFNLTKQVDAVCGPTAGSLKIVLTNANFIPGDYTIKYKLIKKNPDGTWPDWSSPIKDQSDPTFTGLSSGDYRARIYYTKGTVTCHYPEDCITYQVEGGGTRTVCNPPHTDPKEASIDEGNGPIRAFAGVVQLACATPPNSAEIYVANVTGGTNNIYEYSIDNGASWQTNKKFIGLPPGTYTVQVRNKVAAGQPFCEWSKTLQVDAPIAKPSISGSVAYDCDGIARMKITTDQAGYSYLTVHTPTHGATPGALPTTPPTGTFNNGTVPDVVFPTITTAGTQTVRVFYKQTANPSPIVLIQEDFGQGVNKCDANVYNAYRCQPNKTGFISDGEYVITSAENGARVLNNGCWTKPNDHTGLTNGRYLAMNVGSIGYDKPIYTKEVHDVEAHQPIKFKMYVYNLCHCSSCAPPLFQIRVVDSDTGRNLVPPSETKAPPINGRDPDAWHEFSGELAAPGVSSFRIEIVSMSRAHGGNDLALDDIYVYQEPKACASSYVDITTTLQSTDSQKMKITSHTTIDETCNGANDGKLTFGVANYGNVAYTWKVVNRVTTTQVQGGTNNTAGLTVNNLAPGLYTLKLTSGHQVKFSDNQACEITQDFEIKRNDRVTVTQNRQIDYLDCNVTSKQVLFFSQNVTGANQGVFDITGGKQTPSAPLKYTIKVVRVPSGATDILTPDSNGYYRYVVGAGTYQVTITDENDCNGGHGTFTYKVEARHKIATVEAKYTNCVVANGIGNMELSNTFIGGADNGKPVTYDWKKQGDATWTAVSGNTIFKTTLDSWTKGVTYLIRAKDEYSCEKEIEVSIPVEIENLTTADYTVVHPTIACGATTVVPGSITVNHVRGGSPNPTYHYAFVPEGTPPQDTDYTASNTKSGITTGGKWDIYIKDIAATPPTCGKKVNTQSIKIEDPVSTDVEKIGGNFAVDSYSALCEDGQGGKLVIKKFWGKGPFEIILKDNTHNTRATYTIPKVAVPGKVTISPSGRMEVVDYALENLEAGNNYELHIKDIGNGNCNPLGATGYTFSIASMSFTYPAGGAVTQSLVGCTTTMAFALKANNNIQPAADYEIVYRLVRHNGALVTGANGQWVTEAANPVVAPYIAQGLQGALYAGFTLGDRFTAQVGVRRKSDNSVVCTKDIPEFTLTGRPSNVNLATAPSGTCNYNLTVLFGASGVPYYDVQFFLNHDGPTAEDQSAVIGTFTGGNSHTFNNLQKGRTYKIYIHYKENSGSTTICKQAIDVPEDANNRPNVQVDNNTLSGVACSPGATTTVNFKVTVTSGAALSYKVYTKADSGVLTLVAGSTTMPSTGLISLPGQTITAPGQRYVLSLIDASGCESFTHDIFVTPPPTNALTAGTLSVEASTTAMSCQTGAAKLVVKGGATGGTGPFTYSLLQADNAFLRRNIVKRNVPNFNTNVEFDLRDSDFVPGTVYSGITFTFRITDQATGCEEIVTVTGNNLGKFLSSKHTATATLDINKTATGANACDASQPNYKLKITLSNINATGGTALTFADYEYSIDGGNTYTTFPAATVEVDIPALFDQNKVKVRSKESLCDATIAYAGGTPPGTSERLTYPKLKFTAQKRTDMACDNAGVYTAKFDLKITSGSDFVTSPTVPAPFTGANRYEIKVTEGTGVVAGTRNALTTAPAGTTFTTAVTPVGTNLHNQEIKVTYTVPPFPTAPITYNVWVKDLGNKYCDEYVASAPIVVNPAEDPNNLKARHTIDPAKISNVVGCTPGGTTGSFEFTRTITSGREDTAFVYELYYSTTSAGSFTPSGIEVGDADIIERTTSAIRYKVTGLKAGFYQLRVKSSANGSCGQDVTSFSGGVVQITERPIPAFDANPPANPGIEIVQAGCGAATSYGVTPKQSNAQLYLNIKGGTAPYKVEIYEAGNVILTQTVTSTTPPAPYPGPTVYTANATIDLPAKDVDYTIVVKVTDANGCVLAIPGSFVGTVKTLQKITGVTLNRTQQMSCLPAGTEQVTMTVTRTNGSNTGGYNVYIRKMTGAGAPTEVTGYDSAARTAGTAQIGGTGVGTITFPQIAEESADYEITLTDKDTGCTFVVPSGYRVEKAKAPRVNFSVKEGICGDTTSPAPGIVNVTFRVEVEGDLGTGGYSWFVKKSTGPGSGSPYIDIQTGNTSRTGHGSSDEMTVSIPIGDMPQGTAVTFETEVTVVDTQCKTAASLTATRPQNINAVSKVLRYMTYCNGEAQNDAQIGVTSATTGGWGAPYQYRVVTVDNTGRHEGSYTDQMTFTVGEGTHYIEVRDARGCTRKLDSFTFVPYHGPSMQLQTPNAPVATKKPSCVGSQDGEIKLTGVTGGNVTAATPSPSGTAPTLIEGRLSYELFDANTERSLGRILPDDNPTIRGTVTFSGLGAGKYFIRVTSDMLCADDKRDSQVIIVNDPGTIVANAELTRYPGCNTAGDIVVQIEGRPNMDPLRANYKVELYDISAGRPGTLVPGTPTITGAYQTGVTAVFATAVASGPTSDKVYYAKVMDNNGGTGACEGESNEVHVAKVNQIDGAIDNNKSVTSLKCYGSSYGKIVVTATGGKNDEPYVFTLKRNGTVVSGLSTPNPNAQGVFEGLEADDYTVEISQAVGGCTPKVVPVKIEQETEYKVQYEVKQVTCNGDQDGSIEITTTAGQTKRDGTQRKLTYAISPRLDRFLDNGGKFEGLAPGKYYVIVQDENGCRPNEIKEQGQPTPLATDIIEFTITEPDPLSVTVRMDTVEHESCARSNDGKAYLRVIGGIPLRTVGTDNVYEYSKDGGTTWVEYHSDGNGTLIDGLAPGDHTILIRDKNGCQAETTLTIEAGSEVTLKLSQGKYECVNNVIKYVVEASVEPAAEALNVRYLLDGVAHNNTRFELDVDLQTNTTKSYIISVIHKVAGHGECRKDSAPIVVAPKMPLKAQADKITSVSCHDGTDGSFEVVAQGGSGKYEYGLKQADGSYRWQGEDNQFKNLSVGSYTVGVKDTEYGCIYEVVNTTIIAPTPILITQNSITHVGCKGEANGEIEYVLKGGNPQYSWEVFLENGERTSKRGTGEREATPFKIQNLQAGKYLLVVKDAKGCSQKKEFEIIEGVDLKGVITQHYQCNEDISENNKVLVVDGSGPNSDTAAEATYDVYVSVTTPYLVINPSTGGAINRLRYAITTQGGSPIQRYEFNGTTPIGTDNTHNMYKIAHATLLAQLNAVRPLQEGLNKYELHLYYFNKDNPAMSDSPLCQEVRELNIEYYPPIKITNQSIANDLNLIKVKVEGGKERYTIYFSGAQYHTGEEVKAHYVQKEENVKAGDEVVYYVQKTDYEEVNPATGKVEKKVRVYVEDSKGELKEENGGKQVCAHSVFIYKEFMDVVIPNYFTPNGDGEYDTWAPLNLASYPHAETVIYDRYGRQIATLNNRQEWDGTYGGEPLPTGDYWYVLRLNEPDDSRTFKGHFTLYR
ncbi:T9SS type B sorting domain-containing protein [Capnocytophaga gingivalis]